MRHITVLSYYSGYNKEILKRFIGTLYDTGFTGSIVIFTTEEHIELIKELKTKYSYLYYRIVKEDRKINVSNDRVEVFRTWIIQYITNTLEYNVKRYENKKNHYFLLSDVRDVIFQKNPEFMPINLTSQIIIFENGYKDETSLINHNVEMKNMIQHMAFVDNYYMNNINLLADKKIIDTGIILIKETEIDKVLNIFHEHMCKFKKSYLIKNNNLYKSLFNYLLYTNHFYFCYITICSNEHEIVYNIDKEMNVSSEGNCITYDGNKPYIIHHFDKLPPTLKQYMSRKIKNNKYNFVVSY